MQQNNLSFITTGIDLSKLGFKLQDKKMYQSLTSPFVQDQEIPHPFKILIPQSFKAFQFSFQKLDKKNLSDEALIYIFYNVMEVNSQLLACEILMNEKKHRLSKGLRVWVKESDVGLLYFNVNIWKYVELKEKVGDEDFYTLEEICQDAKTENEESEEEEDQ